MTMISAMLAKAGMAGERDAGVWRVVHHYVAQGRARIDASDVTLITIDETAARRGRDYITLFVDIDQARVLFAAMPTLSPRSPTISPRIAGAPRQSTQSAST
jgi:hypothetical protein